MKKLIQSCPSSLVRNAREHFLRSTKCWLYARRVLLLDPYNREREEDVDFWNRSRKQLLMELNYWQGRIRRNACLCRIHIRKAS